MRNWRVNLIITVLLLASAAVTGRLIYYQVMNYEYWRAFAKGQQNTFNDSLGERGKIFLESNSFPVAANQDSYFVYVTPKEIKNTDAVTKLLSETFELEEQAVLEKIADKENLFIVIKEDLTDTEIEKLEKENLQGVYIRSKRQRYYPQDFFSSDILGFVDVDGNGQYGIEGYYNDVLKGEKESIQGERGPGGYLFFSNIKNGSDINLTVDYNIQFAAEKLIKSAVDDLEAESGQIIVIDPNSGRIMAMADYPNFDPNQYSEYAKEGNLGIFQNSATQKIFEPGSVLKPITMAMGLEEGKITPQTTYRDPGIIKIGGRSIYNYAQRTYPGDITMTQVLEKSINTGAVFVEELIPHDIFLDYLKNFGFFEKSGIDLPEVFSENNELKKGYEINYATASFGQGIEMTSMQLVRAFCAIANGGRLVKPYLVDRITKSGREIKTQPEISGQVISQTTASQVTAMMVSVVENGYGKAAKIPGYYIAGKTGTAQVPEGGKYSTEKTIQSFIGFAPAFDPKFIILVKLDNPQSKTAEYSAVPVFYDMAKYIIDYLKITPDYQQQ